MSGNHRRLSFYSDPRVLVPLWVIVLAGAAWFGAAPAWELFQTARVIGLQQMFTDWSAGAEQITLNPLWVALGAGALFAVVGVIGAWRMTRGERRAPVSDRKLVELDPIRRG